MRAVARPYWIKAGACAVLAFVLGMAAYMFAGVMLSRTPANADAAWHQVTVQVDICDCIVKFAPDPPLKGNGVVGDPYITYSSRVPIIVGVSGAGHVEIKDADGNVVYEFDQPVDDYVEVPVVLNLADGLGLYDFTVWLNDAETLSPNVNSPMYIEYRELPVPPVIPPTTEPELPDVPNTGGWKYMYIAGYAVRTSGILSAGFMFAALVFGVFVLIATRKQKREATRARNNRAYGKKMKRELSGKAIDKAGVARKKRSKKR